MAPIRCYALDHSDYARGIHIGDVDEPESQRKIVSSVPA